MGNNNLETARSSWRPQKPPLMWSPVNVANSHNLKSQTVAYFSCTVVILEQKQLKHLTMVCSRMGEGGQPMGIRLSEMHMGREFEILDPVVQTPVSTHLGLTRVCLFFIKSTLSDNFLCSF